jgi:hypothetical protein
MIKKNNFGVPDSQLIFNQLISVKMASRNRLLPVWGSHLGNTHGWERGTIFATGNFFFNFKDFQSCLPTLPVYFPLKFPYGQFPPKIPGPVSQTKSKTKKIQKNYGGDAVLNTYYLPAVIHSIFQQ